LKKTGRLLFAVFLLFAGCVKTGLHQYNEVGFDVDDTLLFSTPAFNEAFQSDARPFSPQFWKIVNSLDREKSIVKKKAAEILKKHQSEGSEIFVITSRNSEGGEELKDFLNDVFGVAEENVYFETGGKAARIKQLGIDIFYGDSDSDIKDALEAGAAAYRILRSTASSYKSNYNPGMYGERIIENSEW